MKKLLYSLSVVLLIAGMTTMTSCKKPEKQIIGKWKVISASGDVDADDVKGSVWTFKENKTFMGNFDGDDVSCDYSCSGTSLSFSGGDLSKWKWSVDLTIDDINKKTMSLSGKIKYSGYYSEYYSVRYELEKMK